MRKYHLPKYPQGSPYIPSFPENSTSGLRGFPSPFPPTVMIGTSIACTHSQHKSAQIATWPVLKVAKKSPCFCSKLSPGFTVASAFPASRTLNCGSLKSKESSGRRGCRAQRSQFFQPICLFGFSLTQYSLPSGRMTLPALELSL